MQGFSLFSLEMCLCGEADVKTGLNMQGFYESRCMCERNCGMSWESLVAVSSDEREGGRQGQSTQAKEAQ